MKSQNDKELVLTLVLFVEFILMYSVKDKFWIIFFLMLFTVFYGIKRIIEIKGFGEHIKNWHLFTFPILYLTGTIFFLSLLRNLIFQIITIAVFTLSSKFLFSALRKLAAKKEKPLLVSKNFISMIGLLIIFLLLTDITNAVIFWELPVYLLMILVFFAVMAVSYFLYWQYRDVDRNSLIFISLISFVIAEISWASSFWMVTYPSFEIGSLGVPVFVLVSLIIYYCFWGIAHHKLEESLTKKVLLEYAMISAIIIVIILLTSDWMPKGLT